MIGVVPFGLAYGIVASQTGLSIAETTLMSLVVFAGAAQFMAVSMLQSGVSAPFIVLSTLMINLRHLLMGLSLSPYLMKQKSIWHYLLAFGMVDESYATTVSHYQSSESDQGNPYFMLGSAAGLYAFWAASSVAGGLLGRSIKDPLSWGLDFAMPATFLSLLIPQIKSKRIFVVTAVAAVVAVAAFVLVPGKWYIIIAALTATALGAAMETREEGRRSD